MSAGVGPWEGPTVHTPQATACAPGVARAGRHRSIGRCTVEPKFPRLCWCCMSRHRLDGQDESEIDQSERLKSVHALHTGAAWWARTTNNSKYLLGSNATGTLSDYPVRICARSSGKKVHEITFHDKKRRTSTDGATVNRQILNCQPWCHHRARHDGGPLAVGNDGPRRCGGTARGTCLAGWAPRWWIERRHFAILTCSYGPTFTGRGRFRLDV